MLIYVCDDSKGDILRLKHHLKKYCEKIGCSYDISEFSSCEDMLSNYKEAKEKPDLIFQDIYMESMNGMEAARYIREKNEKTCIIFTTSSVNHALDAFRINADGYLHKPYTHEEFQNAMNKIEEVFINAGKTIKVWANREEQTLWIRDIKYIESGNHCVFIHGKTSFRVNITMNEICEKLSGEKMFLQCGRSFLLNMNYVDRIDDGDIYIKGREELIAIPVRMKKQITKCYYDFIDNSEE